MRINKLFSAMLFFIFGFLLLEGSVRIGYTLFKDIRSKQNSTTELWHEFTPYLGWERKSNFKGSVDGVERELDSEGFFSVDTLQKSEGAKPKVICLGDSNTFGFGVPTSATFVELVDSWLPDVNLINLGVIGYTSYQGYKIFLKHIPKINPDIVVVSFNYNDRRYVLHQNEIDSDARFQKMHREHVEKQKESKLRKFLDKVYLSRAMRFTFESMGLVNLDSKDRYDVEEIHLDDLYPRVDPENYRRNLIKIVELAKDKNIAVIFMILKDDPIQTSYLREGIEFFKESQYDLAIENLKLAIHRGRKNYMSSNISFALAKIFLARAYEKNGFLEEAKDVLIFKNPFISLH